MAEKLKLIDEIDRCAAFFDDLDEASLSAITAPEIRAVIRRKNGALALSGAFVLFGCGGDHGAPLHIARYRRWSAREDYGLETTDDVFGADIFGDLLFARSGVVFRLDGELGEHVRLGETCAFFEQSRADITEALGGHLGREHFAGRAIGIDPLRLLPTAPFTTSQHVTGAFFEAPLTRALALKHRLLLACRGVPEGAGVDCSFWRADEG